MLALAGRPLGIETVHLDPAGDACAGEVARLIVGAYDDPALVRQLCRGASALTVDLEQVPAGAFRHIPPDIPVWPPPAAVAVTQDRLLEKLLFRELGIPGPAFAAVDGPGDLDHAARAVGLPLLLKTRSGGYDGRGQELVRDAAGLLPAWRRLDDRPQIAEELVAFEREASVIAVRAADGETRTYPLAENRHEGGILRVTRVPARTDAAAAEEARQAALRVAERLGHVGVLTLELFEAGGRLLANEIAPRVHNSGHWTIEAAETSQFENHLRAVCGLPLGSTEQLRPAAMVNLIGTVPSTAAVLGIPGARLHLYGKEPRAGRKLGHVTITAADEETLAERVARVEALLADG